jgi:hypothetical protein
LHPEQTYNNDLILGLSARALAYLHESEPSLQSQAMARKFVSAIQQLALDQQKPLDAKPIA